VTITETNTYFANLASIKSGELRSNPFGFFISAMMAGAYVGVGIILIMSIAHGIDPSIRALVMGVSFGVALTLVVFAGSELYTGYTMYMAHGVLQNTVSFRELLISWIIVWIGNLTGCIALASIAILGNIDIVDNTNGLLQAIARKKVELSVIEMIARGALCNWLVCLALWTCARTNNDVAKILLIFWCLFAFIASGFEHSVANMTVFALALMSEHSDVITIYGAAKNLFWVTIGNTLSGVLFLATAYQIVGGKLSKPPSGKQVSKSSATTK